jgi:hypothetical protein
VALTIEILRRRCGHIRALGESFEDELGRSLEVSEVSVDGKSFRILDDRQVSLPEPAPVTVPPGGAPPAAQAAPERVRRSGP